MNPHARACQTRSFAKVLELVQSSYLGDSYDQIRSAAHVEDAMQLGMLGQSHAQRMMKAPRQTHDDSFSLCELACDFREAF